MHSFVVCIANCNISINTPFKMPRDFFVDFLSDEKPQIQILLDECEISKRKVVKGKESEELGWQGCIDTSIVLQKIADALIDHHTLLIHGAAIALENSAYIFIAPSGTGKTTHILKWLDNNKDVFVINGDKPFIQITDQSAALVYGSPWSGKEGQYTNTVVPLKAIIAIQRAEKNVMKPVSFVDIFPDLLHQIYRPENTAKMRTTLDLLKKLIPNTSFYRFYCNNFKDDCFDVAFNTLVRGVR